MNRKDRSSIISVRIPDGLLNLIENDVEKSGEFCSRADWILAAIRHYLEMRENQKEKRNTQDENPDFIPASSENFQDSLN